jgi:hypothetical protein
MVTLNRRCSLSTQSRWIQYPDSGYVHNVVFTCGAVAEPDGTVKIYWGGADTVMCAGEANIRSCSVVPGARPAREMSWQLTPHGQPTVCGHRVQLVSRIARVFQMAIHVHSTIRKVAPV